MNIKVENIFASGLKAIACIAIVFSLVFSSSSASHAASGAHANHHAFASSASQSHSGHSHAAHSSGEMTLAPAQIDTELSDKNQTSGSCCNGICVTAVLDETISIVFRRAQSAKFLISSLQTASIEPSGFLRPPQYLI